MTAALKIADNPNVAHATLRSLDRASDGGLVMVPAAVNGGGGDACLSAFNTAAL